MALQRQISPWQKSQLLEELDSSLWIFFLMEKADKYDTPFFFNNEIKVNTFVFVLLLQTDV